MKYKKKLIEVALPLEAINEASVREKSIRHGHPSTLHLWWARRPLAACRAVLFASLVDDPSSHPDKFPTPEEQDKERTRLFKIIEDLVQWKNSNDEKVLGKARKEILKSTDNNPPPILDPFCGGGSIPLEAQRLGLKAYASDLNPVAVLITKAMIEIPPKFAGKSPVNPDDSNGRLPGETWKRAEGLAADIRYYGKWMRDEAERRIGHLYPKAKLPKEEGGGEATVIAWLWARTVASPNPAARGAHTPLIRTFWLSKKKGKRVWANLIVDKKSQSYHFEVCKSTPPDEKIVDQGTRASKKATFKCIYTEDTAVGPEYIRDQGKKGKIEQTLFGIVCEGKKGRVYVAPDEQHSRIAEEANPKWIPDSPLANSPRYMAPPLYGLETFGDLFTPRQLVALTTFSDLVMEAREKVLADAKIAGMQDDGIGIEEGGTGAQAYADAVATYLGFAVDRLAMTGNNLVRWNPVGEKAQHVFGRQALPMVWDFAEPNFLATSTGSLQAAIKLVADPLSHMSGDAGIVSQLDVRTPLSSQHRALVCTDPPYYDNIGYSDLSDFFYVWLRRSLSAYLPLLFSTVLTPKDLEMIASPYRHNGDKGKAKRSFEDGLHSAFERMVLSHDADYPLLLYYAFKQAESYKHGESASTGWETMLDGLISSGLCVTGTWPLRTEMKTRQVAMNTNALATSVVFACRLRSDDAAMTTRREFLNELKEELPKSLQTLKQGSIAPVDLAQASIGPGMAVFSRYSRVVESDGSPMTVRTALTLINQTLDEVLAEQEGDFDPDTRWALSWFEQFGMQEADFGNAETLSKAKNTSVSGLVEAGIVIAKRGKVRLKKRSELDEDWDPEEDNRLTVWEVTQQLIRGLEKSEEDAAVLVRKLGAVAETAKDLAYRLYGICEKKKWAQDAIAYNSLVIAWPEISKLAGKQPTGGQQTEML